MLLGDFSEQERIRSFFDTWNPSIVPLDFLRQSGAERRELMSRTLPKNLLTRYNPLQLSSYESFSLVSGE